MALLLLIASFICSVVSVILGFHWLGTDGADWAGWISLAAAFYVASLLAGTPWPRFEWFEWPRRT